jgi:hypothetical protein
MGHRGTFGDEQLLKMIDEIDIDQIGAKKRIEEELDRYKAFAESVLGEKTTKLKQKEVSIRKFAKHILTHGTREEKREILEHFQNAITIQNRAMCISKNF